MELLVIIYILVFLVFALALYAIMQLRLLGIKVREVEREYIRSVERQEYIYTWWESGQPRTGIERM